MTSRCTSTESPERTCRSTKTNLTFTSGNWDTAQTVTVTAGQDDDAVNEEVVTIKHTVSSSADTKYDGLAADNVPVTVTDDDTAGVTISETSLDIEEGDFDTYTVVLDTEPVGDVTVTHRWHRQHRPDP